MALRVRLGGVEQTASLGGASDGQKTDPSLRFLVLDGRSSFALNDQPNPVRISVDLPEAVSADATSLVLLAHLEASAVGCRPDQAGTNRWSVPGVELVLTGTDLREPLRAVTDENGAARYRLDPVGMGMRGVAFLRLASPGSEVLAPGRWKGKIELYTTPDVLLSLGRGAGRGSERIVRQGQTVQVAGLVRDRFGGVAGARIAIELDGRRVAMAHADEQGRFHAAVSFSVAAGSIHLRAHFFPDQPGLRVSWSPPLIVVVQPAAAAPTWYYWAGLALIVLLALVGFGGRFGLPERFVHMWGHARTWWARRGARLGGKLQDTGVALAPGRRAAVFRPSIVCLSGRVVDRRTRLGLDGAHLELRLIQGARSREREAGAVERLSGDDESGFNHGGTRGQERLAARYGLLVTDGCGRFQMRDAVPGRYELVVSQEGYLTASLEIRVPHRGEFDGMVLALDSIRDRVVDSYRQAIASCPALGTKPETMTPIEVLAAGGSVLQGRDADRLRGLTEMVQWVAFSGRIADVDQARRAETLAETFTSGVWKTRLLDQD